MSEKDILVVSESNQEAEFAFVKFRELFFDCSWVKNMFEYPHLMFVLSDDAEIIFVSRDDLAKKKVGWKGWICPDDVINQVVRNRYGY